MLTDEDLPRILVFLGELYRSGGKRNESRFWATLMASRPDVFPAPFVAMPNSSTVISTLFSESVSRPKNKKQHAIANPASAEEEGHPTGGVGLGEGRLAGCTSDQVSGFGVDTRDSGTIGGAQDDEGLGDDRTWSNDVSGGGGEPAAEFAQFTDWSTPDGMNVDAVFAEGLDPDVVADWANCDLDAA
jgi:hypothetical protein